MRIACNMLCEFLKRGGVCYVIANVVHRKFHIFARRDDGVRYEVLSFQFSGLLKANQRPNHVKNLANFASKAIDQEIILMTGLFFNEKEGRNAVMTNTFSGPATKADISSVDLSS